MLGLIIEHVGEVRREAGLREPHVKTVRKPMAQETVQGAHPVCPGVGQRLTITAVHPELTPPRVGRAHLEARGEDQAVHFVLNSIYNDAVLGHAIGALALAYRLTSHWVG